jgi:hypothetical protein
LASAIFKLRINRPKIHALAVVDDREPRADQRRNALRDYRIAGAEAFHQFAA